MLQFLQSRTQTTKPNINKTSVWKLRFMKTMKKQYAIHLSFVHVTILHSICILNMLFTILVSYSQTKFWVIPSVDFGEAISQPRTVFCLRSPSFSFQRRNWVPCKKMYYLSHTYVSMIWRHQPMVFTKTETEKAIINGMVILNVTQRLMLFETLLSFG